MIIKYDILASLKNDFDFISDGNLTVAVFSIIVDATVGYLIGPKAAHYFLTTFASASLDLFFFFIESSNKTGKVK